MPDNVAIDERELVVCLEEQYGLAVRGILSLNLGADANTATYRIATNDNQAYFLKFRSGEFPQATVTVPKYLSEQGMKQIIPPIVTRTGNLYVDLNGANLTLYPFVEGQNAIEKHLSAAQWMEFGAAIKALQSSRIPREFTKGTRREDFSPRWREAVKAFLQRIGRDDFEEPVAAEMAAYLGGKRGDVLKLIQHAEQYVQPLMKESTEFVLCHGDAHGWNLLVGRDEALYLVDWDTLIFAPKERDLMFIGAGIGDSGYTPSEENELFYRGYGSTSIDQVAISYYRLERIIEDISVYCEQLLLSNKGGEDRKRWLENVKSNFQPNGTIDRARQGGL